MLPAERQGSAAEACLKGAHAGSAVHVVAGSRVEDEEQSVAGLSAPDVGWGARGVRKGRPELRVCCWTVRKEAGRSHVVDCRTLSGALSARASAWDCCSAA